MARPALEVGDIFRRHGPAYRREMAGHLSRDQLRVMSAIEACRTAALGGHVEHCTDCGHERIAYNSCRNRHCPKCQGQAAQAWLEARQADLLPVPYFHVVFTLPAPLGVIAYHNKTVVYNILFQAVAETLKVIAADPKHLGAEIGLIAVLHTWGQCLTFHPHIHCIVPGGGIATAGNGQPTKGSSWISCRPGFFLPVRVLSRLFRRLFLEKLAAAHQAEHLQFFGEHARLLDHDEFAAYLAPHRKIEWVVYAKPPFSGPDQVLTYLSRYTHRTAIANSRLTKLDDAKVSFRWRDYRHPQRRRILTLDAGELIRRFLIHVLPRGFHRIRHYGLLASGQRTAKLALCRKLLSAPPTEMQPKADRQDGKETAPKPWEVCPSCQGLMIRTQILQKPDRHHRIKRLDSS